MPSPKRWFMGGGCGMIYFLCVMLFLTVACGKGKGWGAIALIVLDLGLLLAILRVGGWI